MNKFNVATIILELVKHSGLKTQKKFGEKYGFDGAYLSMLKDPNQHYKIPKKMWERFDSIASETILLRLKLYRKRPRKSKEQIRGI